MPNLQKTLRAKFEEAERLAALIKTLPKESEEGAYAIRRRAVVADEVTRLMLQAEELLSPTQLARLKGEISGTQAGTIDLWANYRESEWRLPKFGGPGPGDDPPPRMSLKDFLS